MRAMPKLSLDSTPTLCSLASRSLGILKVGGGLETIDYALLDLMFLTISRTSVSGMPEKPSRLSHLVSRAAKDFSHSSSGLIASARASVLQVFRGGGSDVPRSNVAT